MPVSSQQAFTITQVYKLKKRRSVSKIHFGLLAMIGAVSAQGQESTVQEGAVEEISVTGSRIQRTGMSEPTPVTAMSSEELEYMSPTMMIDSLSQMPQFRNNATPTTNNFFPQAVRACLIYAVLASTERWCC